VALIGVVGASNGFDRSGRSFWWFYFIQKNTEMALI
jgi:hypothetical protein